MYNLICTPVQKTARKMVITNKLKSERDELRGCIVDFVERMPAGGVALVSEIRTAANENARLKHIHGQIRDNRTVAEVLRELINMGAAGALKMDKHGDLFIKAMPMERNGLVNDLIRPHIVMVTIASTDGGSSVTCAEWKKYLVVNETADSGSLLASATVNVLPPTSGTIVVQSGTIVAKNFFDTQYL